MTFSWQWICGCMDVLKSFVLGSLGGVVVNLVGLKSLGIYYKSFSSPKVFRELLWK